MFTSDAIKVLLILCDIALIINHKCAALGVINQELETMCPKLFQKLWVQYAPRGNVSAGVYVKQSNVNTAKDCLELCCSNDECNVMFMYRQTCYHIKCNSNSDCIPMKRSVSSFEDVSMVLVSPLPPITHWEEILPDDLIDDYSPREEDDAVMNSDANYYIPHDRECEIGVSVNCREFEECVPQSPARNRRRSGVCECIEFYVRNETGFCVRRDTIGKYDSTTSSPSQPSKQTSENEPALKKSLKPLVVSVLSKTVVLPEDEVTLSAYVVPRQQEGEHYVFNWILISQPKDGNGGTITDRNGDSVKLSHLVEGVYQFNVTVTAPGAYGETNANVTVLPPKRINKPPVAIIKPKTQTVKLPNTMAVLDGSTSYDDDGIISYQWALEGGPLGYQPNLADSSNLLQLKDLKIPGNYTFKLTVEDTDHETNSTTANITVVKVKNYPPEANAGQDVVVFLPINNVTLNGNLSSDDKGIVSWEWTKSASDHDKAVDMQNTRTPYLELSNLEEGMYTFTLKVTDNDGQSSTSDVRVFVKRPTNKPPTANAGDDVIVSLPRTWVTLEASGSSDIKIVSYRWKQVSGPSKVLFTPVNASKTNASELTRGLYELQVTVFDSNGNSASDSVLVTVNQNENAPPKANAGGDQTVILPVSVVVLNGSKSSDDLAIKKWEWIRDGSSLTLGKVVSDSDKTPVLTLTDLIPGRYVFRLKVTDGQGLSDEDTVSIIVKPDPYLLHLVELTLNIEGSSLTVSQEQSLEANLALLLRDATIHVRELKREQNTGRAILVFYVGQQDDKTILPGPQVVKILKEKLKRDSSLLELSVANIQTAVCQSNCSGHGSCDQATRLCLCEAFWMQNLIRKHFGDGDSNCDWSILYVIIILFVSILIVAGCSWGATCLVQRSCRRPRKRQRYTLIHDGEDSAVRVLNKSVMVSESETDSDVLFNQREKSNGVTRNGSRPHNGFIKLGRRIKT